MTNLPVKARFNVFRTRRSAFIFHLGEFFHPGIDNRDNRFLIVKIKFVKFLTFCIQALLFIEAQCIFVQYALFRLVSLVDERKSK